MSQQAQYVTLWPMSNTNTSKKFRVAEVGDWQKYAFHKTTSYDYTEFDSYEEAEKYQKELNGEGV